ncbi:hypothetical protein Kpol_1027p4 [Vanderwaltozyma polyspora DSM 70294]|uniref:Septin-type G domain-containing protein n=1 Tax=Vanderwaltozyma polyspora (strain ATCC 22028 / DSM 70294 / BCRC 21397 / CBS 2163 / NBRC 10782 / NRRL Y-8283 / UCD 57-17) TaxID=436907 RepID=A7TQK9_VANPO|nr:uncharacterized protein Kpol_1027p4 [Vanderwaltozyma polyspora DSM 70294]EDO15430.1 hypothetical protein Kpol_1027p4 [Vanderwaltozyma polyspora DSM 70294]
MTVATSQIPIKQEDMDGSLGINSVTQDQSNDLGNSNASSKSMLENNEQISLNEFERQKSNRNSAIDSNQVLSQVLPEQPDLRIIRRKITNYVGFANLPKQWHRKSIKKGFNLNILCVSQTGLGKSTLINTLFNKNIYNEENGSNIVNSTTDNLDKIKLEDDNNTISNEESAENTNTDNVSSNNGNNKHNSSNGNSESNQPNVRIESVSTIIEENGVNLRLTVVDTPGFGDSIDNTNSWEPIIKEVDSRFDQYLDAENRINRSVIEDNRIHACLYFIEPTAHFLKPLDLEFCKQIHEKCNLIPIIAKSDILTEEEIDSFKRKITKQLQEAGVKLFKPPHYELDDKETIKLTDELYNKLPFAVVGSTDLVVNGEGKQVRGRSYPWGIVEVDNANHNDFVYLRDYLVRQYLEELRERTNNELYENYRSEKLTKLGINQDNLVFKEFDPETRQKEDKQLHEAKLAKLEAEMKSVFQTKVSEKEKKLQKSEAELFARHKEMKEKLTKQLKALEEKKHQLEMSIANQMTSSPAQKKKGFLR